MRLLLIALILLGACACCDANPFSRLVNKIRDQIIKIRNAIVAKVRAIARAISNVIYMIKHISHWRKAYPDKSLMIVSSGYVVDGRRFMTGLYLTRSSTRHILRSMEGMTFAALGLSEGYAKFLRKMPVNAAALSKLREVMDAMVSLGASYKRSYKSGVVKLRGKTFNVAPNAGDEVLFVRLAEFMKKGRVDQARGLPGLWNQITSYKPTVEAVKRFIVDVANANGKRLVFTTEQHPLKYLLFIYYRGFFLVNLKKVLTSKDGMNEEKTLEKEKEFVKEVATKTDVDNTPPKKNPSEHKGKTVAGSITVTINGKKQTVTMTNSHKFVESQSNEMKSNVVSLSEMLTKTSNPDLVEVEGKTQAIRVNLHITLTIYRFVREHQRQIMKIYTAMKKTIVDVFDYLGNTLRTEMEKVEPPSDAVLERVGPAVDAVNVLMPKLRSAYTKNVDDKNAYVDEYVKIYKDAATVINEEMKRLSKEKNQGKFLKVLALCRVIAKLQRSSYCVFSEQCPP